MSQESSYAVTLKTPRGNLVTVRGDTADEWVANLKAAGTSGALVIIAGIEASLAGQPAPAAPKPPPPAAATQAAQELPAALGVRCETCGGPTRLDKEGVSAKSGLPYKRYACTTSQLHRATFTN